MITAKVSNGISIGKVVTVSDTTPFTLQFVGASETPIEFDLAVICSNATFTKSGSTYTFTPTGAGEVHIIASRSA